MRGKGRIYRPPNRKVWMLAYYVSRPGGRRELVRESAQTDIETLAQKHLETRLRQAANADDGINDFEGPTQKRVTVRELFDDLLKFYVTKEIKSLIDVQRKLAPDAALSEFFGARLAGAVTPAVMDAFIQQRRKEGRKNATINRGFWLLRKAFRLGVKNGRIVRMPAFPEKLPERNARKGFFETGDFRKVLEHLEEPFADMALFAFKTGWRRGMLLNLTWEMVDRDGGVVMLPDSKNDDPQSVPLDEELRAVIDRRWKAREYQTREGGVGVAEYVFHVAGQEIRGWIFDREWRAARKKAGLGGALFHDLRRTAARNMVRGGVPEEIAMKVTGHRSRSMFNRYNIASLEDKLLALQKASVYAESRAAVNSNVTPIRARKSNAQAHEAVFAKENAKPQGLSALSYIRNRKRLTRCRLPAP